MIMTSSIPPVLTPKHVRAARALLAWSQKDLAKAAGVAVSTVADFERGQRTPVANNAQAIRGALEGAGIRFLSTGAVVGPSAPKNAPSDRRGVPIRWVSAEDLDQWANRTDGAISMPTLLAHLIVATHGTSVSLRFPADESVRYSGWDGRTTAYADSAFVPAGEAVWEIGVQRSKIPDKADEDFLKRSRNPGAVDSSNAIFIFVTPRRWPKKDEWAKARQAQGPWREVRVYDADNLVHWIEQAPAVGLWLATRLGKRPLVGTRELDALWQEWSLATKWPLTADLVLSDRDEDAAEVRRWLRREPGVISLQATTSDEVVAFFYAALSEFPEADATAYRARCLVATSDAAARALGDAPGSLIIVMTEPEPGLARILAQQGHHVLLAYGEQLTGRGDVRVLARPSQEGIASALVDAGIPESRAKALARDSARNLAVLRRLMTAAPGRLPKWAEASPPRALLAALLAGGWDEDREADCARLSELADAPYADVVATLAKEYVGEFDSPLQKIGSTWRIASPSDAWLLLARYLTAEDIARFEATAHAVLGSADPRFEMDPSERWMAAVKGVNREYSGILRHGIGQVLILLALWGDQVRTVREANRRADAIVRKLLTGADVRRWWSLSRAFRLLAEASPRAFLTAVEESLDQKDPPIGALFASDEGGVVGAEYLSDLMWALESLAWSPHWMTRVSHVLARLDAIDVKPRQYANGPANSLRRIHLLWSPQTYATLDERLRALDLIRKKESNAAWKLLLGILPRGHDSSSPSPMPRWRDFTVDEEEAVTWGLIHRGAIAITERLLADVGADSARWGDLLDRLTDLAPDCTSALDTLEAVEPKIMEPAERTAFWGKLRRVLHHHRQFPDAKWALPASALDRLDAVYERFAPSDAYQRVAWLFANGVTLPRPSVLGWKAEQRNVDAEREAAAMELYAEGGGTSILALAAVSEAAGFIGKALHDGGLPAASIDALIAASVQSEDSKIRDLGHGLIVSTFAERKEEWAQALLARARGDGWGDAAVLTILRALPMSQWTWDQVTEIGGDLAAVYWRRAPVIWIEDHEEADYAIRKLIDVGRARPALFLAGREGKNRLPTALLVDVLEQAARQPSDYPGDSNDATMFQHYVAEILAALDERQDVDREALIGLEWKYLHLLEHSRRPAKVLLRALSGQPALFVEMLSAAFKPSDDSAIVDPEPSDMDRAKMVAMHAYRLLELWDVLPGTRDDGTIESPAMERWIAEARRLAKSVGREDIADDRIGNMLSASPVGADGVWPTEAVRDVLDSFRSRAMRQGFIVGKLNRRGVTSRMPREGGQKERNLAVEFRVGAKSIEAEHPFTARALEDLAEHYESEARLEDEGAERLDWES